MELNYTQRLLIQSLTVLTVLRWVMAGWHDIRPAEAQLLETIRHLALAGIDGGHLPAWFPGISALVFDQTAFGVRCTDRRGWMFRWR